VEHAKHSGSKEQHHKALMFPSEPHVVENATNMSPKPHFKATPRPPTIKCSCHINASCVALIPNAHAMCNGPSCSGTITPGQSMTRGQARYEPCLPRPYPLQLARRTINKHSILGDQGASKSGSSKITKSGVHTLRLCIKASTNQPNNVLLPSYYQWKGVGPAAVHQRPATHKDAAYTTNGPLQYCPQSDLEV